MNRVVGALAACLGHIIRIFVVSWRFLLLVGGVGFSAYGVFLFDRRAGWVYLGVALLVLSTQGRKGTG